MAVAGRFVAAVGFVCVWAWGGGSEGAVLGGVGWGAGWGWVVGVSRGYGAE